MHFGHCQQFALVTIVDNKITGVTYETPPPHEPGVLPKWLHEQGADVIIAGGMGQRAMALFSQAGIEVIVGAPTLEPDKIVEQYLAGSLQTGGNVCDH
ncbi:MAG: NifB/NifX family molybdenum-iron cluster-binding protein [Planctomycetes bacterium]|nr:NifB/NifX family molybdenum-iron cluster-binding protein [Planctomycetota bacterium]